MKDRACQAAMVARSENQIMETRADPNMYGCCHRTGELLTQSNNDPLISQIENYAKFLIEGDIEACFDRIDHPWLLENTLMNQTILRKFLKAGFLENKAYHPTLQGTPQGGPISSALAFIALSGLEGYLKRLFPAGSKVNVVSYAGRFYRHREIKRAIGITGHPLYRAFLKDKGTPIMQRRKQEFRILTRALILLDLL